MNKFIVTTSWDDGHKLDLKLAYLLKLYKLSGTFYIPKKYLENALSEREILELSRSFEIGAHTINHAVIPDRKEILLSKIWLEKITKKPVLMFCYPRGKFDDETKSIVKKAGFLGARTTVDSKVSIDDFFEIPTTIHVYPVPFWKFKSWLNTAKESFDRFMITGGIFHLWGHSWELEKYRLWNETEAFFKYVSNLSDCSYMTNSEVLKVT